MRPSRTVTTWFYAIALAAVAVVIAVLTWTALPAVTEGHLGGDMLMFHMMASGVLVFLLPVLAFLGISRFVSGGAFSPTWTERFALALALLSGWICIALIFACMLPLFGTQAMRDIVRWHGYAGFAMVPATVVVVWGAVLSARNRRRSASPG